MKKNLVFFLLFFACLPLCASQTNISVPLGDPVYYYLDQAQMRGVCETLPSARPYSERFMVTTLQTILDADARQRKLTATERQMIQQELASFERKEGMDWSRGAYFCEQTNEKGYRMTLDAGARAKTLVSGAYETQGKDFSVGTDDWVTAYLTGDMGDSFSWAISGSGGAMQIPCAALGTVDPFCTTNSYSNTTQPHTNFIVYSDSPAYFPFTSPRNWDFSIFHLSKLSSSGFYGWPDAVSFGYNILSEMDATFLGGHMNFRFGRIKREWGAPVSGNSLVLNENARPFLGVEGTWSPFPWLAFSSLTGVLEYVNPRGSASIQEAPMIFQNAYSLSLVECNPNRYFHLDFGSSCIWPKRFELGYLFPLDSNFFYQNNIGDFDNLGLIFNAAGSWPGIGKMWVSFYADEFDLSTKPFFHLDRNMYAYQAGLMVDIPNIPFASFSAQYTKIEPYTYTHQRTQTPWNGSSWMEIAYVNNGVCIGYYLPPNSDEVKLRFDCVPSLGWKAHAQYQMIRHGAEYGSKMVDGSSLSSELDPDNRGENPVLRKYFLHDGAYQWIHVIKVGGEYSFASQHLPLALSAEFGLAYSRFTDIDGAANAGYSSSYHAIDTDEYPTTLRCILSVGCTVYY